jgi:hypothetical protein
MPDPLKTALEDPDFKKLTPDKRQHVIDVMLSKDPEFKGMAPKYKDKVKSSLYSKFVKTASAPAPASDGLTMAQRRQRTQQQIAASKQNLGIDPSVQLPLPHSRPNAPAVPIAQAHTQAHTQHQVEAAKEIAQAQVLRQKSLADADQQRRAAIEYQRVHGVFPTEHTPGFEKPGFNADPRFQVSDAFLKEKEAEKGSFWNRVQPGFDDVIRNTQGYKGSLRRGAAGLIEPQNVALLAAMSAAGPELGPLAGRLFTLDMARGLAQSAMDTSKLKSDPRGYWGDIVFQGAVMGLPHAAPHLWAKIQELGTRRIGREAMHAYVQDALYRAEQGEVFKAHEKGMKVNKLGQVVPKKPKGETNAVKQGVQQEGGKPEHKSGAGSGQAAEAGRSNRAKPAAKVPVKEEVKADAQTKNAAPAARVPRQSAPKPDSVSGSKAKAKAPVKPSFAPTHEYTLKNGEKVPVRLTGETTESAEGVTFRHVVDADGKVLPAHPDRLKVVAKEKPNATSTEGLKPGSVPGERQTNAGGRLPARPGRSSGTQGTTKGATEPVQPDKVQSTKPQAQIGDGAKIINRHEVDNQGYMDVEVNGHGYEVQKVRGNRTLTDAQILAEARQRHAEFMKPHVWIESLSKEQRAAALAEFKKRNPHSNVVGPQMEKDALVDLYHDEVKSAKRGGLVNSQGEIIPEERKAPRDVTPSEKQAELKAQLAKAESLTGETKPETKKPAEKPEALFRKAIDYLKSQGHSHEDIEALEGGLAVFTDKDSTPEQRKEAGLGLRDELQKLAKKPVNKKQATPTDKPRTVGVVNMRIKGPVKASVISPTYAYAAKEYRAKRTSVEVSGDNVYLYGENAKTGAMGSSHWLLPNGEITTKEIEHSESAHDITSTERSPGSDNKALAAMGDNQMVAVRLTGKLGNRPPMMVVEAYGEPTSIQKQWINRNAATVENSGGSFLFSVYDSNGKVKLDGDGAREFRQAEWDKYYKTPVKAPSSPAQAAKPVESTKVPTQEKPASTGNVGAKLPAELSKAKPRYGYGTKLFELEFDNDIDRAAYITAQTKPSARDADYRKFLTDQGMSSEQIKAHGEAIRAKIKEMARTGKPEEGPLKITRAVPRSKTRGAVNLGPGGLGRNIPKESDSGATSMSHSGAVGGRGRGPRHAPAVRFPSAVQNLVNRVKPYVPTSKAGGRYHATAVIHPETADRLHTLSNTDSYGYQLGSQAFRRVTAGLDADEIKKFVEFMQSNNLEVDNPAHPYVMTGRRMQNIWGVPGKPLTASQARIQAAALEHNAIQNELFSMVKKGKPGTPKKLGLKYQGPGGEDLFMNMIPKKDAAGNPVLINPKPGSASKRVSRQVTVNPSRASLPRSGTGVEYETDLEKIYQTAYKNALPGAVMNDIYSGLVKNGIAKYRTDGPAPTTIKYNGVDYPATTEVVRFGKKPGEVGKIPIQITMPAQIHADIKDATSAKPFERRMYIDPNAAGGPTEKSSTSARDLEHTLTDIQLASPKVITGHSLRVITMVTKMIDPSLPGVRRAIDTLLNAPTIGVVPRLTRLYDMANLDPVSTSEYKSKEGYTYSNQSIRVDLARANAVDNRTFDNTSALAKAPGIKQLRELGHGALFSEPKVPSQMFKAKTPSELYKAISEFGLDIRAKIMVEKVRRMVDGYDPNDPKLDDKIRKNTYGLGEYVKKPGKFIEILKTFNMYAGTSAPMRATELKQFFGITGRTGKALSPTQRAAWRAQTVAMSGIGTFVGYVLWNKLLSGHMPWDNATDNTLEFGNGWHLSMSDEDPADTRAMSTLGLMRGARDLETGNYMDIPKAIAKGIIGAAADLGVGPGTRMLATAAGMDLYIIDPNGNAMLAKAYPGAQYPLPGALYDDDDSGKDTYVKRGRAILGEISPVFDTGLDLLGGSSDSLSALRSPRATYDSSEVNPWDSLARHVQSADALFNSALIQPDKQTKSSGELDPFTKKMMRQQEEYQRAAQPKVPVNK